MFDTKEHLDYMNSYSKLFLFTEKKVDIMNRTNAHRRCYLSCVPPKVPKKFQPNFGSYVPTIQMRGKIENVALTKVIKFSFKYEYFDYYSYCLFVQNMINSKIII